MTAFSRTNPNIEKIMRLLRARCGLSFRPSDYERVERGIIVAQQRTACGDLKEYEKLLHGESTVWDDLIVELTVGETYFFREPMQFDFIRDRVLPEILKGRDPHCPLRLWSAGCASGEEAYSLAILLDQQQLLSRADILATDISTAALSKARAGVYREWSLRGAGAVLTASHLKYQAPYYVVEERIRRRVKFEVLNLAVDSYPSIVTGTRNLDLILCRNVLIYFDGATVQAIAERFFKALAAGGWLLTAASDPSLHSYAAFETIVGSGGIFYRKPLVAAAAAAAAPSPGVAKPVSSPSPRSALLDDHRPLVRCPSGPTTRPPAGRQSDAERGLKPEPVPPSVKSVDAAAAESSLEAIRQDLSQGHYQRVLDLTSGRTLEHDAWVIRVQALANMDVAQAEQACNAALAQHPLSTHLHYLHAVLLSENNRGPEAAEAARRVIYLDRKLVVGHLVLGSSLRQAGDLQGAMRAFRNARSLCSTLPPEQIVPFSDGETAAQIDRAAQLQMQHLASSSGVQ